MNASILPNRSRPSGPPSRMDDDQRKAMFAAMGRRGGGGGSGGGRSGGGRGGPGGSSSGGSTPPRHEPYVPRTTWRDRLRVAHEMHKGFWEGLGVGSLKTANAFTFGKIGPLKRAAEDYSSYPGANASEISATIGREALLAATSMRFLASAGAAWKGARAVPALAKDHIAPFVAVGGFGSQALIDQYRAADPTRHYGSDKALGMASQLAGLIGGMGAFGSVLRYGGSLMRAIPASRRLNPAQIAQLDRSPFMQSLKQNKVARSVQDLFTKGSVELNLNVPGGYPSGGRLNVLSQLQRATHALGDAIGTTSRAILERVTPAAAGPTIDKMLRLQRASAHFTGATLREIGRVPHNIRQLGKSKEILRQGKLSGERAVDAAIRAQQHRQAAQRWRVMADADTRQAEAIRSMARTDGPWLKEVAYRDLKLSHAQSLHGTRIAPETYKAGRRTFYDIERGVKGAEDNALQLFKRASHVRGQATAEAIKADVQGNLSQRLTQSAIDAPATAAEIARQARYGLAKAGLVTAGMAGTAVYDEYGIRQHQAAAADHFRRGDNYPLPQDTPRGTLGTLAAAMVGWSFNNPGEKQIRPGRARWQAEQGAARAARDLADQQLASGKIDRDTWRDVVTDIRKPWAHESGRELWTVAPATAIMADWKIGDLLDRANRSTTTKVLSVYDGDTLTVDHRFPGQPEGGGHTSRGIEVGDTRGVVRLLGFDTPEIANPFKGTPDQLYGPEAAARLTQLASPGQTVRVVQDSNQQAAGVDAWNRQLATVQTVPKGLNWALNIPYLGKALPARDVGETMLREGWGDIRYRHLSGRTDTAATYDVAREAARDAGLNVWSEAGREAHPWVGQERTVAERSDAHYRRMTGEERPDSLYGKALTPAAIGLMTSGNTGIFRTLGRGGPGIAQAYNLLVAALGAAEYNERAARTAPSEYYVPHGLATDYQAGLDEVRADLW